MAEQLIEIQVWRELIQTAFVTLQIPIELEGYEREEFINERVWELAAGQWEPTGFEDGHDWEEKSTSGC